MVMSKVRESSKLERKAQIMEHQIPRDRNIVYIEVTRQAKRSDSLDT